MSIEDEAGGWSRRHVLAAGAGAFAAPLFAQSPAPARSRLILLGTKGGPTPSRVRALAANLLLVGDAPYVIDCPDGVARQLVLAGVDLARLANVFITHHHSDHNAGLGSLALLAWGSGLQTPLNLFGPPPLARMTEALLAAFDPDIRSRIREEGRPPLAPLLRPRELSAPGAVIEAGGVRVTCALVDHYTVRPALAYRFDTPDRSFVFSGDTAPSPGLIALAAGADVLVHEVMLLDAISRIVDRNAPDLIDHLVRSHTTTEQLGRVAAEAGVRTLVLSHLVPALPDLTDEMWIEGVRRHFSGEIIVGRDMMEI